MAVLDQATNLLPGASIIEATASLLVQLAALGAFAYAGYKAWIWYQHKHKIIVHREFGDSQKQYDFDKARPVKQDGDMKWHLRSSGKTIEAPPSEALEPKGDGNMVAHVAVDTDDNWTWLKSKFSFDDHDPGEDVEDDDVEEAALPSRASYVRQIEREQDIRGRSFWDKNSSVIVGAIAIAAVIMVNAYAGQMLLGSVQEVTVKVGEVVDKLDTTLQTLEQIETGEVPVDQAINETGSAAPGGGGGG